MKRATKVIYTAAIISMMVTPAIARDPLSAMLAGESAMQGETLEKAIENASEHPVGSAKNPVRAHFPPGQRAYLARLRCADGNAPQFSRIGSAGMSPYKNIADIYGVDCGKAEPGSVEIYMDMYHKGYIEKATILGFSITDISQ